MPRQPRSRLPDGIFHVIARAVADEPLFVDDHDRKRFLWLLDRFCGEYDIQRLAYCLMGRIYHLLLEGGAGDLSRLMHRLNSRYARRHAGRTPFGVGPYGERRRRPAYGTSAGGRSARRYSTV